MRFSTLLLSFFMLSFFGCDQAKVPLYVGTYTQGESEGIYRLVFDQYNGQFSDKTLFAKATNPSFLAFGPDKNVLYSVHEQDNFGDTKSGAVGSFKVLADGALEFINTVSSRGAHPCHVVVNAAGTQIAVSNYSGGTVALFNSKNGRLNDAFQVIDHNTPEQRSHAHSALFSGNFLYVADLGRNAIFRYSQTASDYKLDNPSLIPLPNKAGPRHFVLSADAQFLYAINEYANTVSAAQKSDSGFTLLNHFSTLSNEFDATSFCADIHLSKDERFLYGSNRGENTIVVFERSLKTGKLQRIQNVDVRGNWPRNFTLSPNGKFLLVANQKSNNITIFKVDSESGKLEFFSSTDFPSPVCLLF